MSVPLLRHYICAVKIKELLELLEVPFKKACIDILKGKFLTKQSFSLNALCKQLYPRKTKLNSEKHKAKARKCKQTTPFKLAINGYAGRESPGSA